MHHDALHLELPRAQVAGVDRRLLQPERSRAVVAQRHLQQLRPDEGDLAEKRVGRRGLYGVRVVALHPQHAAADVLGQRHGELIHTAVGGGARGAELVPARRARLLVHCGAAEAGAVPVHHAVGVGPQCTLAPRLKVQGRWGRKGG